MLKSINHSETRQHILDAALKCFARFGYAGASVQQIVSEAGVSKPALYYYFADKAKLFAALVDRAHDERYRLMQDAAKRGRTVAEKLEEIVGAIFEFSLRNQELMRLQFATAFAASDEAPGGLRCRQKGRRNFEFIKSLIKAGQASGELSRNFTVDELTMGIYGQLNSYVMVRLLMPDCPLDRGTARRIVELFVKGSAVSRSVPNGSKKTGNGAANNNTERGGDGSSPRKIVVAARPAGTGRPRPVLKSFAAEAQEAKEWAASERVPIKFKRSKRTTS